MGRGCVRVGVILCLGWWVGEFWTSSIVYILILTISDFTQQTNKHNYVLTRTVKDQLIGTNILYSNIVVNVKRSFLL